MTFGAAKARAKRSSHTGASVLAQPRETRSSGAAYTKPRHYHLANEEAIHVLEGSGTFTLEKEQVMVAPDIAVYPDSNRLGVFA